MPTYKTKGIILKTQNYGEADEIQTIFTARLGKIKAIAKAIRKPKTKLSGFLEPLYWLDLQMAEGRTFDIVAEARVLDNFQPIRASLSKTAQAYVMLELTDSLIAERQVNYPALALLRACFAHLAKNDKQSILPFFKINLIKAIGYAPILHGCLFCQAKDSNQYFLSFKEGGIICQSDRGHDLSSVMISRDAIKLLRLLSAHSAAVLERLGSFQKDLRQLNFLLDQFITYRTERQFKAENIMNNIIS